MQNLAIATAVKPTIARLKHLQLVHLRDTEALLIVVTQEAKLRQHMIHLGSAVDQDTLTEAANRLNRLAAGKSIAELRSLWG